MFRIAAVSLLAFCAAPAVAGVFDRDKARDFCGQAPAVEAEECLADQEIAGMRIDRWLDSGRFTRVDAKRAYVNCSARSAPDLRRVWSCLDQLRDNRRNRFRP